MHKSTRLISGILVVAAMAAGSLAWQAEAAEQAKRCENYDEYWLDGVAHQNDIWNRDGVAGTQCLITDGWEWDWPDDGKNRVHSYPSVYIGKKPWSEDSTTDELPVMLSEINSYVVNYGLETEETGLNNTAFDIWITSIPDSRGGKVRTNDLMIWLRPSPGWKPAGTWSESVTVAGQDYDLFTEQRDSVLYVAFIAREYKAEGTLDIAKFLDLAIEREFVDPKNFLRDVELGNEIMWGKGKTIVLEYSGELN